MELKDLNDDERAALVALVRFTVTAEGDLAEQDSNATEDLLDAWGDEGYGTALAAATRWGSDVEGFKALLARVTGADARELIYGTVLEMALPETVTRSEGRMLDLVGELWGLGPEIQEPQ
jgi:hypothetical protein